MRAFAAASALGAAYVLVGRGMATVDLGIGRTTQPLGPRSWEIGAAPETVFDVIASPYLGRTPRALAGKLQVWERGEDMVLAAHFTPTRIGVATTVETVRFERPSLVEFRVVRGPVPHLREAFELEPSGAGAGTRLTWSGELGTDLWAVGRAWGRTVAGVWERAVASSLAAIAAEAERRAG